MGLEMGLEMGLVLHGCRGGGLPGRRRRPLQWASDSGSEHPTPSALRLFRAFGNQCGNPSPGPEAVQTQLERLRRRGQELIIEDGVREGWPFSWVGGSGTLINTRVCSPLVETVPVGRGNVAK